MRYAEKSMMFPLDIMQPSVTGSVRCSTSLCRLKCATAIHINDVSLFLILTTNSIELYCCINYTYTVSFFLYRCTGIT